MRDVLGTMAGTQGWARTGWSRFRCDVNWVPNHLESLSLTFLVCKMGIRATFTEAKIPIQ